MIVLARLGRGLLERWLGLRGWRWSRRVSRFIDWTVVIEERGR